MKTIFLSIVIIIIFFSCSKSKKEISYEYELKCEENVDLKFKLNDSTEFKFIALFPYIDNKSGREYLTFMSQINNSILFYDFNKGNFLFEVKIDKDGPNGIGNTAGYPSCTLGFSKSSKNESNGIGYMGGYCIEDFDNIYVPFINLPEIVKIDTSGRVLETIKYPITNNGYHLVPNNYSISSEYKPMIIHDKKIYITQMLYNSPYEISDVPVSTYIDTAKNLAIEMPFRFPKYIKDKGGLSARYFRMADYSREFNGSQFIYSFSMDENIYVTSVDSPFVEKKFSVKSKYIPNLKFLKIAEDRKKAYIDMLGTSCYGNLLYDKYRNVYYRFTHIRTEYTNGTHSPEILFINGVYKFSIIILDKDFNVIGETLFPEQIYNPLIAFVNKEGLYISDSNLLNPSFDKNILSFKCFTMEKKKSKI